MNWQIIVGAFLLLGGIVNITTDFGTFAFGVIVGGILTYWGLIKKGYLKNPLPKLMSNKAPTGSDQSRKSATYYLAGVSYCQNNVSKIAIPNPAWNYRKDDILSHGLGGSVIYRYKRTNKVAEFRDEPSNPHDKDAIAVYMDSLLVGYIKHEDIEQINNIRKRHSVKSVIGCITGGDYKIAAEDGSTNKDNRYFSVSIDVEYV